MYWLIHSLVGLVRKKNASVNKRMKMADFYFSANDFFTGKLQKKWRCKKRTLDYVHS